MNKKLIITLLVILALILLVVLLVGRNSEEEEIPLTFLSIWDADSIPGRDDDLNFGSSMSMIRRERESFIRGMDAFPSKALISEKVMSEKAGVIGITNDMAELFNNADILMTVGASTEDITLYTAFGAGFFNIPMLIPFSDGDLDAAAEAGTSFRLTSTGQQYADFIGTYIAPKNLRSTFSTLLFGNDAAQNIDIRQALFFPDDFNGHGTAVEIAQTLMDSGVNLEYYGAYDDSGLPALIDKIWETDGDRLSDLDVVYMLGRDQDPFTGIAGIIKSWKGTRKPAFILIGYVPEVNDPELWELENVFMLEQDLDLSGCPADIGGANEGIAYAAGYITKLILDRVYTQYPKEPGSWKNLFRNDDQKLQAHLDYVDTLRTAARTELLGMDENIPCFGQIKFDLTENSQVRLGLVRYTGLDISEKVSSDEILNRIYERLRGQYTPGSSAEGR